MKLINESEKPVLSVAPATNVEECSNENAERSNYRMVAGAPAKRRRLHPDSVRSETANVRLLKTELVGNAKQFLDQTRNMLDEIVHMEHQSLIQNADMLWNRMMNEFSEKFLHKIHDKTIDEAVDSILQEWIEKERIIFLEMKRLERLLQGDFDEDSAVSRATDQEGHNHGNSGGSEDE